MRHTHNLMRAAAGALAIAAIAAPAATAQPIDLRSPDTHDAAALSEDNWPAIAAALVQPIDLRSPGTHDAALSQREQDLRRLAAGGRIRSSSLAGSTSNDKKSAIAAALAQEQSYRTYVHAGSQPQEPEGTGGSDDSTPWAIIALAVGLGVAGAAVAAAVTGRTRRARVAA